MRLVGAPLRQMPRKNLVLALNHSSECLQFRRDHCGQCLRFWRDLLQRMRSIMARFIATNAYNFGVIHCSECVHFGVIHGSECLQFSARCIAANDHNFLYIGCCCCCCCCPIKASAGFTKADAAAIASKAAGVLCKGYCCCCSTQAAAVLCKASDFRCTFGQ